MNGAEGVAGDEARLLLFRSAGERFALDVDCVREIVPLQEVTPVPLVRDAVAGVINHRGAIFTVVSFAALAGLGEDRPGAFVLLRLPELAVGLAVGAVEGIERVAGGPAPAAAGGAPPPATFLSPASDAFARALYLVDAGGLAEAIVRLAEPATAATAAPPRGQR